MKANFRQWKLIGTSQTVKIQQTPELIMRDMDLKSIVCNLIRPATALTQLKMIAIFQKIFNYRFQVNI
jgi:hypothetical protein